MYVAGFGSQVPADIALEDMARARTRFTARLVCGGLGPQVPAQDEDTLRAKGSGSMNAKQAVNVKVMSVV